MPSLLVASPVTPTHKVGETKQFGGVSYTLNQNHRWERTDKGQLAGKNAQLGGKNDSSRQTPMAPKATSGKSSDQLSGGDHAQRHAFTKSQLSSVQGPARGIMAALQEHPDVAAGGAIVTQDFAPEQAGALHQWISQNVGQEVGGGQARDLGQGKMGFSTPAGAVVVWPADASGKHQVKYTNQTGPVARAMRGGSVTPPPVQSQGTKPPPPPDAVGENPFAPASNKPAPGFEPSKATGEQLASASALTEKPAKPAPPSSPREAANQSKDRLSAALAQWQDEVAGGLTPKGNARWRSYTAALRSIWSQHETLANDWERKGKAKGGTAKKPGAADGGSKIDPADDLSEMEARISEYDPNALKEIKALTQRPGSYRDMVRQTHDQLFPDQAKKRKPAERQPSREQSEPKSERREQAPSKPAVEPAKETDAMERLGIKPDRDPEAGRRGHQQNVEQAKIAGGQQQTKPNVTEPPKSFDTPPQEQPAKQATLEGSSQWKALVRKKASEWDMTPDDFHDLASDLHKELVEHHGQRKAAYLDARKSTGLSPADINKLENQGYDSGSKHAKIKQLDTIGRELASQYPALGWGRGREGDGDDEGDIDYAENLWALIRGGYKPPPGKNSSDFIDHVEEYLRSQMKSAGSSGVAGGNVADDDNLSAIPFSKARSGLVYRYRLFTLLKTIYGRTWTQQDEKKHWRNEIGRWVKMDHANRIWMVARRGDSMPLEKLRQMAKRMFEDFGQNLRGQNRRAADLMLDAAESVVSRLAKSAVLELLKRTTDIQYYGSNAELMEEFRRRGGKRQDVLAFFDHADGSIHLNGGKETNEGLYGLRDVYAHEIAHLLDHDRSESNDEKWLEAWNAELADGQLGEYAAKNSEEGWAEFGEVAILDPETAKANWPACYDVWKSKGLVI